MPLRPLHPDLDSDMHPLFVACHQGRLDEISDYLESGGDVNIEDEGGFNLLATAIAGEYFSIIQLLIAHGVDVNNASTKFGLTPLHGAVSEPKATELVGTLLAAGADVNAKDKNGYTALMGACGEGRSDLVRFLLDHGADPHVTAQQGMTAFMLAAQSNQPACLEILAGCGTDVNGCDSRKKTALHWAAQRGNAEAVKWLLDHGADRSLRDGSKYTALDWATQNGHAEVVELLKGD